MFTETQRDYLRQHIQDAEVLQTVSAWLDAAEQQVNFKTRMIEEFPQLIMVLDNVGRIIVFNHACELLTGFSQQEMLFHPAWELLLPVNMQQPAKQVFDDPQPRRIPSEGDVMFMTKSGETRITHWVNNIVYDSGGAIEYIVSTGRDVTEEVKRREQERALTEAQLRFVFEQASVGIALTTAGLMPDTTVNPAFVKILGYSADELRHMDYTAYTHPDDIGAERCMLDDVMNNKRDFYHIEKRCLHKDGHIVWGHYTGCILRDAHGAPVYSMGILDDISERKHAEEQMALMLDKAQRAEKLYRLIAENATDVIFILSPQFALTYISPSCFTVLGYTTEEMMADNPMSFIHPDDADMISEILQALHNENLSAVVDYRVRLKSGGYAWMESSLRVVLNADNTVQEIIGISRDVNERKTYEEALALSNRELEAFTSSVSHDLRAPLRAIDGFARMLLDEHAASLAPDVQRLLSLIHENSLYMGRLINDLLVLSRISRQPIIRREVDLAALVMQTYAELDLQNRVIDFTVNDLPIVQADGGLLKVVFDNLLRNAVKFTAQRPMGVIEVGCEEQNGEEVYWIKDNGVGFNMQYSYKLFKVFQRLHRAEDYEGTGVGLATVERIIHRHGGRVWAYAEPEKGATFYFTLRGN